MTDISLLEDVDVELVQHVGSDRGIAEAARVSLLADRLPGPLGEKDRGLINYLLREKHGTPFEHNAITFRVRAPIFVFREWHRHRIQSYNEMSGRYIEMLPEFYVPSAGRPLVNVGTSSRPEMGPAPAHVVEQAHEELEDAYQYAWRSYQNLLGLGIAKEVARLVLPVGLMSQMYVTANLRAWMHFLSLRTHDETAAHVSRPQREIEMAAEKVEAILADLFPTTIAAFNQHGRVAP